MLALKESHGTPDHGLKQGLFGSEMVKKSALTDLCLVGSRFEGQMGWAAPGDNRLSSLQYRLARISSASAGDWGGGWGATHSEPYEKPVEQYTKKRRDSGRCISEAT